MVKNRGKGPSLADSRSSNNTSSNLPDIILKKVRSLGARDELSLGYLRRADLDERARRLKRPQYVGYSEGLALPEQGEGLLAKYLDRPELVKDVLNLPGKMKESPESLSAIAAESAELGLRSPTNQSGHAKSFKKVPPVSGEAAVQAFKMPTYRVVTPRTWKKIRMLPNPTEDELARIDAVESEMKAEPLQVESRKGLYKNLRKLTRGGLKQEDDNPEDLTKLRHEISADVERLSSPPDGRRTYAPSSRVGSVKKSPSPGRRRGSPTRRRVVMGFDVRSAGGGSESRADMMARRIQMLKEHLEQSAQSRSKEQVALDAQLRELRAFFDAEGEAARRKTELLLRMVVYLQEMYIFVGRRSGFSTWQYVVQTIVTRERNKAALSIQTKMRQTLAKIMVSHMHRMVNQRSERQKALVERRLVATHASAVKIQCAYRRWRDTRRVQRLRKETAAASLIARNYRVMQEYNKAVFFKLATGKRDRGVVSIQCCWRGYWARSRLRLLKKIKAVRIKQENKARYEAKRLDHFRKGGAALTLQRFWRRVLLNRKQAVLMRLIRQRQATVLQKHWRHFRARRNIIRLRTDVKQLGRRRNKAAILIQRQVRIYLAKSFVDNIKFQQEKRQIIRQLEKEEVKRTRFVTVCNCIPVDTWLREEVYYHIRHGLNPLWPRVLRHSATDIQRIFRGHRARRRVRLRREIISFNGFDAMTRRRRKAVIDLQRVYRGRRGRRIAMHVRQLRITVLIQKLWRGHVTRLRYSRLMNEASAATVIQKFTRRYLAHKRFVPRLAVWRVRWAAALVIQSLMRKFLRRQARDRKLDFDRRQWERKTAASKLMHLRMRMAGHKLLLDSFYGGFNFKVRYRKHSFDGVAKHMFLHFAQSKDEDRLEGTGFILMMRQSPGLLSKKSFTETDADILFTRLKEPNGKHMVFTSWLTALDTLGASMYADVKRYDRRRGRDARLLSVVYEHLFKGAWSKPYTTLLEDRVKIYVHVVWARVQALIRGWLARRQYQRRLANWAVEEAKRLRLQAAILVQAFARRLNARRAAVALARKSYVKYIDPTSGLPYWYMARQKRSLWVKPKIFGPYDIPRAKKLPDRNTEFLIMCVNCDSARAATFCESCEEAYCSACFEGVHLKGHKRAHFARPILMCLECDFQMATKACRNCFRKSGGKPAHYCDTCFWHIHETDADESFKRHMFESIVMNCIECERFAARWRCLDCSELYCTGCFAKVHSRGKKLKHKYEGLRYYTTKMHHNYEVDVRLNDLRKEMVKHMLLIHAIQEEKRRKSATKIQAAYRGLLGRRVGKRFLKAGRRKMREAHRQRKADSYWRNGVMYYMLDCVALAPNLRSDTTEERVTQRFLTPFVRSYVRKLVEQNVEFGPGMMKDRKKVPKRGFGYGTVKELREQGWYGGVRLPGYWSIKEGDRFLKGDLDLRTILDKTSRIRIKDLHFSIDSTRAVQDNLIYINRLWRRDDLEEVVIYKMPTFTKPERITHLMKWLFITSPPVQLLITGRASINKRIAVVFEQMAQRCRKAGVNDLAEWLEGFQAYHLKQFRRIGYLLNEYQERYTQTSTAVEEDISTEEEAKQLAAKEDAKRKDFENKYVKKEETKWETGKDPRTGKRFWTNKETGEVVYKNPLLSATGSAKDDLTVAQQKLLEAKKRREAMKKRR